VDLGLYATTSGDDRGFVLHLQHARTWVNDLGGQWRNELQLGSAQVLATSFYQPLDIAQRYFVEPRLFWNRDWQSVFHDHNEVARYQFDDRGGRIDIGMNISDQSQLRVGYIASQRRVTVETGSPLLPQLQATDAGIVVSALYDSRDTPFRPTRGLAAALEYFRSDALLGAPRNWQRAELGLGVAVPFRQDVLWIAAAGGTHLGSALPADRLFALGGPGSFPGYQFAELRAASYWTFSGSYFWPLKDIVSLRGHALYAGLRLQAGHAYDQLDGQNDGQVESASLYITGRTRVGLLTVGFATTSTHLHSLWLSLGRPVLQGTILDRGLFW
jgi:NTE family protein